jgi:hypothetical protein
MSTPFNLDIAEAIEDAFERASGGKRTLQNGYDYRTARRSLNLLTMEWANRGVNLWTLEQGTIPLSKGVGGYQMPSNTIDLIEYSVRTTSASGQTNDQQLARMSVSSYSALPNKRQSGKPQQVLLQRLQPNPVITLWPVPDRDDYTLVGWRLRRVESAAVPGTADLDVPFRFIPALVAGLAFYIAQKIPEGQDRAVALKQEYESVFDLAALEDRDKSTTRFVPRIERV